MAEPSWMLARLKRETFVHHATADGDRLALLSADATTGTYRQALVRIYGFESPIEAAVTTVARIDSVIDTRSRAKVRLLKADLIGIGVVDPVECPRYRAMPFRDVAEALAWLYVVERNTLLHGVIHRHLSQRIPDQMRVGGSYLAYYDRAAGSKWRELGLALDRVATSAATADRIVSAANAAFRAQRHWYDVALPPGRQQDFVA